MDKNYQQGLKCGVGTDIFFIYSTSFSYTGPIFFYGYYGNKSLYFFLVTVPWYLSYMFTVMSSSSSLNSCPQMTFTDIADASPTRPNLSYMDGATNSNPVFLRLLLSTRWCVALHYGARTHYTFCFSQRAGIC